jgi:hypothetical protein
MPSDDKLNEARLEAGAILAMPQDEVLKLFHRERKQGKLGRLLRHLDRLALNGGEDARIGEAALKRLGFSIQ